MYAGEDEFTPTRESRLAWPEIFPYMQVYGKEIAVSVQFRTSESKNRSDSYWSSDVKTYLVLRFFAITKGFHKGSLDLTGRHQSRYMEHVKLWIRYLEAYREYCQTQSSHSKEFMFDKSNDVDIEITPYVDEDAIWLRFCKAWKIPPEKFDFEHIEYHTEKALKCLRKHPIPIFQRLCITDLPDDVLQVVFDHTGISQGRLLGSTCRRLSDIGYRYRFQHRRLAFSLPSGYWKEAYAATDKFEHLTLLALSERSKLLSIAKALLSNEDGMGRVESLQLINGWTHPSPPFEDTDPHLDEFLPAMTSAGLYGLIYQAWTGALQGCKNLTSLDLHCLVLHFPVLQGICNLAHLRDLDLFECEIPDDSLLFTHDSNLAISTGAVQTLVITFPHETDASNCWFLLPLFTNLQNLSIRMLGGQDFDFIPIPPVSIANRCRFWDTLESLQLSDLASQELDELAGWFDLLPPKPSLQQFRLSFKRWVPDESFIRFLQSLNVPHLQILVLSGLQQGEEALFTTIAELFPDLRALSLDRRASNRQITSRPTPWPLQVGQYAQWVGLLPELRYFSWNRSGLSYWETSSYPILRFENGFLEELDLTWEDYQADEWDPKDYAWTAKTFAAYCPKLDYYTTSNWLIEYFIERKPHGEVEIRHDINQKGVNWLPMGVSSYGRGWNPQIPDVRA